MSASAGAGAATRVAAGPGRGYLITFEGGEGAGKTTQVQHLAAALRARGLAVVTTREPGGSPGAEQIRQLLVAGETGRWGALTEALLHYAARRDHLERTIWPALAAGQWVLSDRFADSTRAYQGAGQGLAPELLAQLQTLALGDFTPDLTLILDLPPEHGLARARGRQAAARGGTAGAGAGPAAGGSGEDRYERMDLAFHQRLRQGFLELARQEPGRCRVIAADRDQAAVAAEVLAAVAGCFDLGL